MSNLKVSLIIFDDIAQVLGTQLKDKAQIIEVCQVFWSHNVLEFDNIRVTVEKLHDFDFP